MKPRLTPVDPATQVGGTKEMLDAVNAKLGAIPNMIRTMAINPAVLRAYLSFSESVSQGVLGTKVHEQIALVVAETNRCSYCLSAHSVLGRMAGLTDHGISEARNADASDPRVKAALAFATKVAANSGAVHDEDFVAVRAAGLTDVEIAEIVAVVALNIYTNLFNLVSNPEIDFPVVKPRVALAA